MSAGAPTPADARAALARLLGAASAVTVFTGAGISTECGVPDYRSPGSPWRVHAPIGFADYLADPAMRIEAWRRKFAMDDLYAGARPGRGHRAVARWAAAGLVRAIVTQNIDGLHGAAAGPGTRSSSCTATAPTRAASAAAPATSSPPSAPASRRTARCPSAAAAASSSPPASPSARPWTVATSGEAIDAALDCDLFVVLGSTLLVRPAARFPELARRNGARLAIVNREPTPLDGEADLVIRGDIGDVLDPL